MIKEYGIQLQNIGTQIMNIGLQLQNMMNSFGIPLQNMGQQISSISMQIFNMGMQISDMNIPLFNNNLFQGQNIFNMNINKNMEEVNTCIKFDISSRGIITINCNNNISIEELIKRFLEKVNYKENKEKLLFVYNGKAINQNEKKSIVDYGLKYSSILRVLNF